MKVLVLGGTRFFGIHMVNALIHKGHDVTIATRGMEGGSSPLSLCDWRR